MKKTTFWGCTIGAGIGLFTLGSFIAFIPIVGFPLMAAGVVIMIVGFIMLIPLLIKERKMDNKRMRKDIDERELRP